MRMRVLGSRDWSNYSEIMRQFTLVLDDMKHYEDKNLTVVHSGGRGLEDMISEYVGKVEKFLRQKGYSVKEELFRNSKETPKSTNDYEMISNGADYALVFKAGNDKRAIYCAKMLDEFQIPYEIINE
jgi:hypothetical protein